MLVLPGNSYLFGGDSGDSSGYGPFEDSHPVDMAMRDGEGVKGTPIEMMSGDITIPAGKQYFVYYNSTTNSLREMTLPNLGAGLPTIAQQAIDLSPAWLKQNLTRKFGYMSEVDIDIGLRSNPAFADMDGDGDYDLAVGENTGVMNYFENVDDGYHYYEGYDYFINAVYVEDPTMFGPLALGTFIDPTLADMDGDTDVDMVVGNTAGELLYVENTGVGWAAPAPLGISVASYSTPYLVDFDGDLDYDLFVGDINGNVYYSNNNSVTFDPLVPVQVGGLDIDVGAYSNPAAADFFDDDGDLDLVVGAMDGRLDYFRNDGAGVWTDVTSNPDLYAFTMNMDVGDYSSPTLLDMDSNVVLDMVIGANSGNVHYRENIGTAANPKWLVWSNSNTDTAFNNPYIPIQLNNYYEQDRLVKLKHRISQPELIQYAQMIIDVASSPDTINQLDELVFTIAHSSTTGLLHVSTFPEVYRNNTEVLYYNDQFIDYANILDFNLGTQDQWSTVEYWVNESGKINSYQYPKHIYYWFIVHPKISAELVTFINPEVPSSSHVGATALPPTGKFWRWQAFNEADPDWPIDPPGTVKYPKVDLPPLLKDHLQGVTTMYSGERYNAPGIYNNSGFDTGARPWDYRDHAVEKISQWVERTLPLNAQEHNDNNRPNQPVRIQWEHNGNCGELGDLTAAAMRSALIPAVEHVSIPQDHCWNHFYERWWHGMDNYWSAGGSIIDDNDRHVSWNRDWSNIISTRGDTLMFDTSPWDNRINDYNGDGYQDRGNVSVIVRDVNGFPVDGVKVAVGDWSDYNGYKSTISQWTYTGPDGKAYFRTSESRQGDTYNDGLLIHVGSKLGGGELNPTYGGRFKICIDPPNLPVYAYDSLMYGVSMAAMPRPHPQAVDTNYVGGGSYIFRAGFDTLYGIQHPPNALGQQDGKTYHDFTFSKGVHLDSFIADTSNFQKYLKGEPFDANSTLFNETSGVLSFEVPAAGDWYFVLSNQDTIETSKKVNVTVELFDFPTFVPDSSVEPPTNLTIGLSGDNFENVTLNWDLSLDDPLSGVGEDDITKYEIYFSRVYDGSKQGYTLLDSVPFGTSTYTHPYARQFLLLRGRMGRRLEHCEYDRSGGKIHQKNERRY
jgi:hypothetical protein